MISSYEQLHKTHMSVRELLEKHIMFLANFVTNAYSFVDIDRSLFKSIGRKIPLVI